MMNDYAWTTLHAHRESEHRARALHRGGDDLSTVGARHGVAHRLALRLRRLGAAAPAASTGTAPDAVGTVTAAAPAARAAARRTASDAPTAAARAWVRLASGRGTLEPAATGLDTQRRKAA